jgi:hypothetical protein
MQHLLGRLPRGTCHVAGLNTNELSAMMQGAIWKNRLRGGQLQPVELGFQEDPEGFAHCVKQDIVAKLGKGIVTMSAIARPKKSRFTRSRSSKVAPTPLPKLVPFRPGGAALGVGFGKVGADTRLRLGFTPATRTPRICCRACFGACCSVCCKTCCRACCRECCVERVAEIVLDC